MRPYLWLLWVIGGALVRHRCAQRIDRLERLVRARVFILHFANQSMHANGRRKSTYTNVPVEVLGELLDDETVRQVLCQFPARIHAHSLARTARHTRAREKDAPARLHVERVPRVERGVEDV